RRCDVRQAPPPRPPETCVRRECQAFPDRHCRWLQPPRPCNPSFTLRGKMPPPALMRKGKRQRFYARNALKTTLDRLDLGAWAFDAIVLGHPCQFPISVLFD